jgi:hypothetical protein
MYGLNKALVFYSLKVLNKHNIARLHDNTLLTKVIILPFGCNEWDQKVMISREQVFFHCWWSNTKYYITRIPLSLCTSEQIEKKL